MKRDAAVQSQRGIKECFCLGAGNRTLHGELMPASHTLLTEQSIFIKDSKQFNLLSEIALSEAVYYCI